VPHILKNHKASDTPKLFFYADPGAIIGVELAQNVIDTWKNIKAINLGQGSHFLQESHPHEIGEGIVEWYNETFI